MKSAVTTYLLVLLLLVSCNKGTSSDDLGDTFALINCTIISGTGDDPIYNAVLVVEDDHIRAVGNAGTTPVPPGVTTIDLAGATVLPGFFNTHIHSGFNRTNLEAWAREGVTTVRDLCGPTAFDLRDALMRNPACARLIAAGPMISVPSGYPYVPWGSSCMLAVTSVEDARQEARQLLLDGADLVKLSIESGESFGLDIPTLSHEEAVAIVEAAHEFGTVASAHVLVSYDLGRALETGADDIAHMVTDYLPDSLITRMVDDDVYWVPTIELWMKVGHGMGEVAIGNLRRFVQAGGKVATGTDYDGYDAVFELGMPLDEMRWMIQAGMSRMQVIVAGTKNAATVCNRQADLGTLEAGKIADILVVNGDPLADIGALGHVLMVIHNGVAIRDER